ncbi:hypothetical protein AB0I54_45930 [Streptomyces sp. NPDC050625]|uniref:hypothetical protein n=1 Tax=Streptomyces sp. NPDC050625 TaxID=3154629 RepID=UPI0034395E0A
MHDFLTSSYGVRSPNLPELTPYAVTAPVAEKLPRQQVTPQGNDVTTPLSPRAHAARLEVLRRKYMAHIIAAAACHGRPVRVAPYTLTQPGAERHAGIELIEKYAAGMGWQVTRSTFAAMGQPSPLAQRAGLGAACRYAAQGYAHGILAIARPALTTDNEAYAQVLEHLHVRGLFLAYLPTERDAPA